MKRIKFPTIFICFTFGFCFLSNTFTSLSQEEETIFTDTVRKKLTEKKAEAKMDWDDNFIYVVARGAHPLPGKEGSLAKTNEHAISLAEETANTIAFRKILETLEKVNVSASTTLKDEIVTGTITTKSLEGYVQGSQEMEAKCAIEGESAVCFVARGLMLNKEYGDAKPTEKIDTISEYIRSELQDKEEEKEAKTGLFKPKESVKIDENYTGIIIDARELKGSPAIFPKITTKDGKIVYGAKSVEREYAIEYGVANWSKNLEKAESDKRVMGKPLVIKAVAVEGNYKANYVVQDKDAAAILEAGKRSGVLNKGRVVFVSG